MFQEHPLRLDWSQSLPKYYFDASPFKTHLLNALSVTFPHGEKFFIDSVKHYQDKVTDPDELAAVRVFVKQENWHRHVHQQYNTWLTAQSLPAERLELQALHTLQWTRNKLGHRGQLCVTACMEHVTAIFAEHLLTHPKLLASMHPHFRQVWTWHSIEEIEHKAVALNTLNAIGGGRRRMAMILTTANFAWDIARNTMILLQHDGQLFKWRTVTDAWSLLFSRKHGLVTGLIRPWFTFMRRDFHPDQHNSTQLLLQFSKA